MPTTTFLNFTDNSLQATIVSLTTDNTLLVTDEYNFGLVSGLGSAMAVEDTDASRIGEVISAGGYSRVIAIGGCTALDFGRACARGMWLAAVPTILSNCCISSSRSVIRRKGNYASEETTAPCLTTISLPTIIENHSDQRKNWSASGLGDLISMLGAVAEANWEPAEAGSVDAVFNRLAPICMEALKWIALEPYPLTPAGLKRLAEFLHDFSVAGHKTIAIGSEHALYYTLRKQQQYPRMTATHGKLVSIGTLLTLRAWSEANRDFSMYNSLRAVYAKVGLPLTFGELEAIGVLSDHIIEACGPGKESGLYSKLVNEDDASLLERVYGEQASSGTH